MLTLEILYGRKIRIYINGQTPTTDETQYTTYNKGRTTTTGNQTEYVIDYLDPLIISTKKAEYDISSLTIISHAKNIDQFLETGRDYDQNYDPTITGAPTVPIGTIDIKDETGQTTTLTIVEVHPYDESKRPTSNINFVTLHNGQRRLLGRTETYIKAQTTKEPTPKATSPTLHNIAIAASALEASTDYLVANFSTTIVFSGELDIEKLKEAIETTIKNKINTQTTNETEDVNYRSLG